MKRLKLTGPKLSVITQCQRASCLHTFETKVRDHCSYCVSVDYHRFMYASVYNVTSQGSDERGHTTVAKLLKNRIEGGRTVGHKRNISQVDNVSTSEDALPDLKKSLVLSATSNFWNRGYNKDIFFLLTAPRDDTWSGPCHRDGYL